MPPGRAPTLQLHSRGQYFTKWGGSFHYFGTDKAAAERAFLDPNSEHPGSLAAWFAWKSRKPVASTASRRRVRIVGLVDQFCERYEARGNVQAGRYHRKHLNRFTHALGKLFADELTTDILAGFAASMHELRFPGPDHTPLKPSTINKDIKAVRSLVRWASDLELCRPLRVRRLELLPEPQVEPQDVPVATIQAGLRMAAVKDPRVETAVRLHYLTAARPSELIALLWRRGSFVPIPPDAAASHPVKGIDPDRCVFKLERSKTQHATGLPRYLVLSPQAIAAFDRTRLETRKGKRVPIDSRSGRPFWATPSGYAQALRDDDKVGAPFPTSAVRPTAATQMHYLGADYQVVDRALGHVPQTEGRNYIREAWPRLLEAVGRLSL
ncbi:MAG: hypothetical protein AAFR96_13370 [Planctomycetota bacterium]